MKEKSRNDSSGRISLSDSLESQSTEKGELKGIFIFPSRARERDKKNIGVLKQVR